MLFEIWIVDASIFRARGLFLGLIVCCACIRGDCGGCVLVLRGVSHARTHLLNTHV